MKLSKLLLSTFAATMLAACSGGSTPLKDLAEAYVKIADNNLKVSAAFRAVYSAPETEQQALMEEAQSISESVKSENESLAEKAAKLGQALEGQEIKCEASQALGIKVISATFTTVDAGDKLANIVITAEVEGTCSGTPYFFLMANEEVLYKSAARCSDGKVVINFRITTNKGSEVARLIAKTQSVMLVTLAEYNEGAAGIDVAVSNEESESQYQGIDNSNTVNETSTEGIQIEKGANLVAVLKAATGVTYEYNADSGIWAHIGNVSIIIDEDQLNQKGIDFINSIPSDIEPNLAFSPDYLKSDAKVLNIEKN